MDHKNLSQDGIGLNSNRVTRWRILLEEHAPQIIYIKVIHNKTADAISRLDYDPKLNSTNEYNNSMRGGSPKMADVLKILVLLQQNTRPSQNKHDSNESRICKSQWGDEIYPFTVKEIVEAQKADAKLKHLFKRNAVLDIGVELKLVENESHICNEGKLVITKPLQWH
jgi:hypothetical protein